MYFLSSGVKGLTTRSLVMRKNYKHEKVNLSRGRIQYSVWPMQAYRSHISLLQSPADILVLKRLVNPANCQTVAVFRSPTEALKTTQNQSEYTRGVTRSLFTYCPALLELSAPDSNL